MKFLQRVGALACAAIIGLLVVGTLAPATVSAHESRDLLNGKYQAVVRFLTEPTYQGQVNGLDLTITSKFEQTEEGANKPIEGLEKTLKAQVLKDGRTLDLALQSRFGMPGKYAAYFQPTASGQYQFRVYGEIDGERLDEHFESGPGRFGDVQSLTPLQFPAAVPQVPADLQARLDAAESAAGNARAIGIVGLGVDLLGLGVGVASFLRRPTAPGRGAD